jgi:hypothetical protein
MVTQADAHKVSIAVIEWKHDPFIWIELWHSRLEVLLTLIEVLPVHRKHADVFVYGYFMDIGFSLNLLMIACPLIAGLPASVLVWNVKTPIGCSETRAPLAMAIPDFKPDSGIFSAVSSSLKNTI